MIGYRISRAELGRRIEAHAPGWLERAAAKTAEFRRKRKYEEPSSIWSEVKPVYMELQGGAKCAFCERKLEPVAYGTGEQAVEHFRPKGSVASWTPPVELVQEGVTVKPPGGSGGYYLLAYDILNYTAACNPCNSALKRNWFPVEGRYRLTGSRPESLLKQEKPLLIYPIGEFDDRPEDLIRFHGVSPQAVAKSGYKRRRALVTIELFKLDSTLRDLERGRAMVIIGLYGSLKTLAGATSEREKAVARSIIQGFTAEHAPHANCARSFERLFREDFAEAEQVFERAAKLVEGKS